MSLFSISLEPSYVQMLIRLLICTLVNWFIVDRLYYRKSQRRDFYFTFILISIAIFLLVFFMIFVLEDLKAKTSIGIGIGLFGIFSIMRYRTDAMPVREMTYLFSIISLAVVNAIATNVSYFELILTNLLVVAAIWICEARLKQKPVKLIQYDRIDLITPDHRQELIDDIEERTGIHVVSIEVGGIDFLRDMAVLKVTFDAQKADLEVNQKTRLNSQDLIQ
jgi:hypothetical protein